MGRELSYNGRGEIANQVGHYLIRARPYSVLISYCFPDCRYRDTPLSNVIGY